MRTYIIGISIALLLSLVGCTPSYTIKNRNIEIPQNKKIGMIAIATKCYGYSNFGAVFYQNIADVNNPALGFIADLNPRTKNLFPINCATGNTQYNLIKLEVGKYQLISVGNRKTILPETVVTAAIKPHLYFRVYSGKVNYLGRLIFNFGKLDKNADGKLLTRLVDNSNLDIPIFQAKYPKLPHTLFIKHLLTLNKDSV